MAQETEPASADRALWRERYVKVEAELRARDVSALGPDQREARAAVLRELRAYATAADFGLNGELDGWRAPFFVDAEGRRCAIAHLLHADGNDALVEAIAERANHAFVADLAAEPALLEWLDAVGLSLEEAARIQGPALPENWRATIRPETPPPVDLAGPATPGAGASSGGRPAGASGAANAAALAQLATSPDPRRTGDSLEPAADGWWLWWEMNKLAFLRPNRLSGAAKRGLDLSTSAAPSVIVEMRGQLLSRLVVRLRDPEAPIRAAACVALARLAGGDVVHVIEDLIHDPSHFVRERAMLALGATGSPRAQRVLIEIARTGRADGKLGGDALTQTAKTTALVALGLGRRYGMNPSVDAIVDELLAKRRSSDRRLVGLGGVMYQRLVQSEELWPRIRQMAASSKENLEVRCRAIETLAGDAEQVALLTKLAAERHLDVRRSALLALGDHASSLALPALLTAYDLERDPATRGFAAMSIGRQGGEQARDFLIGELRDGPLAARPWNALALGVLNYEAGDDAATHAILAGLQRERNVDARGAYLLAAGLSRDVRAVDAAREALFTSRNERTRMYAATALSIVGGTTARMLLNERLKTERSDLTRAGILQGLGALGHAADAPGLIEGLHRMSTPEYRIVVAVALGFHGTHGALSGLLQSCDDEKLDPTAHASAIDALGLLLGRRDGMQLAELSRQSNFTLYEPWMLDYLRTTL